MAFNSALFSGSAGNVGRVAGRVVTPQAPRQPRNPGNPNNGRIAGQNPPAPAIPLAGSAGGGGSSTPNPAALTSAGSGLTPRQRAFLDTIAHAEGTAGPDGYRTMFTGRTFDDLSDHPRIVNSGGGYHSSAAGRYQFLESTWDNVARQLDIGDFSPASQDRAALELIRQRGALDEVDAGDFEAAIHGVNREWASLPGSPYGQPTRSMDELRRVYQERLNQYMGVN